MLMKTLQFIELKMSWILNPCGSRSQKMLALLVYWPVAILARGRSGRETTLWAEQKELFGKKQSI